MENKTRSKIYEYMYSELNERCGTSTNYKSPFSARLRIKLQLACGSEEATIALLSKQNAPRWFRAYLLLIHSIIRSSVPLMQAAYDNCINSPGDMDLVVRLRKYYKKHIQEEMHHDEWILEDLESIGVSRRESLSQKPSQKVAELVGSQYYWIYHWHPVCLLGHISFLEGNPPKRELIYRLQEITGYPDTAFRTLIKHSDLDRHHRDDLDKLLGELPLTTEHEQWITSNALYSAYKLSETWDELPIY